MEKVLVSNVNWLGDSLLMSPLLRALKEKKKVPFLALFTHKRTQEIFWHNPFVDEIIVFEEKSFKNPFKFLALAHYLANHEFDTVFLLKSSFSRALLFKLARIKDLIGFAAKKRADWLLARKVYADSSCQHRMDYYLQLAKAVGIEADWRFCDFFVSPQAEKKTFDFLASGKKTVVLHPQANWPLKRWPPDYFCRLCDLLAENLKVQVVISGSRNDVGLCQEIAKKCRIRPFVVCGQLSLAELAVVIKRSDLFISADTGIMHLAAALNTPLIALFGPTSSLITGPRTQAKAIIIQKDVGCEIPCYNIKCPNNLCMQEIKPEEVLAEATKILA